MWLVLFWCIRRRVLGLSTASSSLWGALPTPATDRRVESSRLSIRLSVLLSWFPCQSGHHFQPRQDPREALVWAQQPKLVKLDICPKFWRLISCMYGLPPVWNPRAAIHIALSSSLFRCLAARTLSGFPSPQFPARKTRQQLSLSLYRIRAPSGSACCWPVPRCCHRRANNNTPIVVLFRRRRNRVLTRCP